MYWYATAQQTSTVKLSTFFSRFESEERVLRANKSKITCKKTFDGDDLGTEGNHGLSKHKKSLFGVFSQIYDYCFNTHTPKQIYLCFSTIVCF